MSEEVKVEEKKKLDFLDDYAGDRSSKRLAGFIFLGCTVLTGLFLATFGSFFEIPSVEVIQGVFNGFLWGTFGCFSLTVPEAVSDLLGKK